MAEKAILQRPDIIGTLRSLEVDDFVIFPRHIAKVTLLRVHVYQIPDKKFTISEKGRLYDCIVTRIS